MNNRANSTPAWQRRDAAIRNICYRFSQWSGLSPFVIARIGIFTALISIIAEFLVPDLRKQLLSHNIFVPILWGSVFICLILYSFVWSKMDRTKKPESFTIQLSRLTMESRAVRYAMLFLCLLDLYLLPFNAFLFAYWLETLRDVSLTIFLFFGAVDEEIF